ncbi:MAG: GNAT family N-acetyltransferase [Ruegeria sp.]|uniref:GNAT family N-acetyltransferase n=1 Tax=Ruegeria sp. TaxID=1879320 RepID=UPI00349EE84E
MDYASTYKDRTDEIIDLFTSTFTASEGAEEGRLIGQLVTDMFATANDTDMFVFSALHDGAIVGAILFTRLTYPQDDRNVFLLSPVAVATHQQGKGIGQKLLRHGLNSLRQQGVDAALTYGDINFYSKVGFNQITEVDAQAPLPLQYPQGWLGQSLTDRPLDPLKGPSRCVDALNSPDYW